MPWKQSRESAQWWAMPMRSTPWPGGSSTPPRCGQRLAGRGFNISSLEVEEVLSQHPAVLLAAVVARPDPTWGESPCAFLELKLDVDAVDEAEIIRFCRERLARFKVPKRVIFGDLPKTSTGKIQKFALRDQARES